MIGARFALAIKKLGKDESGQSLVEFALVLPVLLLILIGIIDFGKIFSTELVIEGAALDAARYASVGATDAQVNQVIQQDCATLQISQLTVTIAPTQSNRVSGQPVVVTISYPVNLDLPLTAFLPNPLIVHAATAMRVE